MTVISSPKKSQHILQCFSKKKILQKYCVNFLSVVGKLICHWNLQKNQVKRKESIFKQSKSPLMVLQDKQQYH